MSDVDYDSAVALIGMAGRFPGADSVDGLWNNLLAGVSGLRELSEEELIAAGVSPAQLADPSYVRTSGSIDGYDRFDATLFGVSRREAETMDPQHRLFLECCYAALENAGYPPTRMPGRVGVFGGCGFPEYLWNVMSLGAEAGGALMLGIGTERDSFTSQVSYKLNLSGPSVTVQTFCSSSLVAVHLGVQALLNFECEYVLAGGSFIPLPQDTGYMFEEGSIYSPDGKIRAFDAGARGSVAASGVSTVVLKRLADAIADGDHITAVVLGSAVNNDGSACAGYTAPGVDGQATVIADAISFAGVEPRSIGYVECHGTGTVLGDSIELAAMARVFPDRPDNQLVLGSLKASIGHLDRAAGTSSLIRAALAVRHGVLPGTPNFSTPNSALTAERKKFTVRTETQPWPENGEPRRAGVSSFGLGGTNSHVVIEEPPTLPPAPERPGPHLLTVSARDDAAVQQAAADLATHLDRSPALNIADVAYTLQQSRSYFPVRRAVVCDDLPDGRDGLAETATDIVGEVRQRVTQVALTLPDPAAVDLAWCATVRSAAGRLTGTDQPPADATLYEAALAVAHALRHVGLSVGRISGPDSAAEQVAKLAVELGLNQDTECQAEVALAPDGASTAHWLHRVIARLWCAGAEPHWAALHTGSPRRVPLPTYPFQRKRFWVERQSGFDPAAAAEPDGRVDDLDSWTYLPTWRSAPLPVENRTESLRSVGPWLVLSDDQRGEAIAAHLREIGADVAVARIGPGFRDVGNGDYEVKADCADDLGQLLSSRAAIPRTVVLAHTLGDRTDEVTRDQAAGYDAAVAVTIAYSREAPDIELNLLAVTAGAVGFAGVAPTRPAQAALAGLLPTLAQENPGWLARHVDVDAVPGNQRAVANQASAIVAEAVAPYPGQVALRGTSRWVRTFTPLALPEPEQPLPPGSRVMITGGLGYVGLLLARHLAVARGCRVALVARTTLPPHAEWAQHATGQTRTAQIVATLLELEALGAEILPVAADLTDGEQARAAIDAIDARFGGLDLVVHAAGISDPRAFGPAHLVAHTHADTHFDAKITGLANLRTALTGRDIAGITLSSLSAVLGGLALGPYSASNAALDAYVLLAREREGIRWITVDWDTWGKSNGEEAGEFDMSPDEAVAVFDRALAAIDQVDHVVISTGSLPARYQQWVVERGGMSAALSDDDGERDPRPDLSTPYIAPREGTEVQLAEVWSRVLRLEMVGLDDDFFRLGGNSVLAIELVARIRKTLKVPVPTSAVMGFPTVRGLAAQIDEMSADSGPTGG
ncbi:SDR family NAD(P)-dependent oxidoreductase [Micromonospora sp. NPDC049044]|uniref:SDR family NAD(P)-dependent oxidoreductase n=1 Tax=unclassified Micromonospora TaxID=2617518 RepID=UPI0033C1D815